MERRRRVFIGDLTRKEFRQGIESGAIRRVASHGSWVQNHLTRDS